MQLSILHQQHNIMAICWLSITFPSKWWIIHTKTGLDYGNRNFLWQTDWYRNTIFVWSTSCHDIQNTLAGAQVKFWPYQGFIVVLRLKTNMYVFALSLNNVGAILFFKIIFVCRITMTDFSFTWAFYGLLYITYQTNNSKYLNRKGGNWYIMIVIVKTKCLHQLWVVL